MRSALASCLFVCLLFLSRESVAHEEQVTDSIATTNLIAARAKNIGCSWLAGAFLQELVKANGGKGSGSFRQFSDSELKDIIAGYDRIESEYCEQADDLISSEGLVVRQSFNKSFFGAPRDDEIQGFFQRKDVLYWAKRNGEFIAIALPISTYVSIIRYISPERYVAASPADARELEVMSGGMVNLQYLYYIIEALRSDRIKPILPSRFNLPRLQGEAQSLNSEAQGLFKMPEAVKYQVRVETALREATSVLDPKLNAPLFPRKAVALEKLKQLATRSVKQAESLK